MCEEVQLPVSRACSAARLSRAAYYKAGMDRAARDQPVIEALNEIVAVELRWASGSATTGFATWVIPGITSGCIASIAT